MRFVLKHHHVAVQIGLDVADVSHFGDIRRSGNRNRARRHQAFGLQLLATEADHHHFAAEIRIQTDVAYRADRHHRVRRVDRDAATIGVPEAHDIVDVRVVRQQFGLDARDRVLNHIGHALHRGRNGQDVARAHRAVGIAIALEREAFQRRHLRRLDGRDRQIFQSGRTRHADHVLVDPTALRQGLERVSDHHVIADDFVAFREIGQRDFVSLRNTLTQRKAIGKYGALPQTAVVDDDRDIVIGVNANVERGLFHCIDPYGSFTPAAATIHTSSYNMDDCMDVPYLPYDVHYAAKTPLS